MMYLFQDKQVEEAVSRKEDIESLISTYQMRVNQAQHLERELAQIEE